MRNARPKSGRLASTGFIYALTNVIGRLIFSHMRKSAYEGDYDVDEF